MRISCIVRFSRRNNGLIFHMPKGRKRSIILRLWRDRSDGWRIHSILRVFLGRFCISYFSENFSCIAFLKSSKRDISIVNPAACRCHPYRLKYSLQASRSSMRLHHSGERHEATRDHIHFHHVSSRRSFSYSRFDISSPFGSCCLQSTIEGFP